jgi:hypothetical protein
LKFILVLVPEASATGPRPGLLVTNAKALEAHVLVSHLILEIF